MNGWRPWLVGLTAYVVSACAQALVAFLSASAIAPDLVHSWSFWKVILCTIALVALKTTVAYLAKSPLPGIQKLSDAPTKGSAVK